MKNQIIALLLLLSVVSCKEERSGIDFPAVTTSENIIVGQDGAQIDFAIEYAGTNSLLDCGVEYRINTEAGSWNSQSLGPHTGGSMSLSAMLYTNLLPDLEYVARAYAKTTDRTVYGNEVVFVSQGSKTPQILAVEPLAADMGDTITIRGKYFSTMSGYNSVWFNTKEAVPVFASDSLLKVLVPRVTSSSKIWISVSANLQKVVYDKPFSLAVATISKIVPEFAFPGDEVTLTGDHFRSLITVIIDGSYYQPTAKTDSTFTFTLQIKETTGPQTIQLLQLDRNTLSDKRLTLVLPEFISASPEVCWIDTIVKVRGKYLDRLSYFGVDYDWYSRQVISQTDSLVVLKLKTVFGEGSFTGSFRGIYVKSNQLIRMNPPVVTSIEPSTAKYGETVTLKGDRFYNGLSSNDGELRYVSKNEMKFTLGTGLSAGENSIHFNSGSNMVYPPSTAKITVPQINITGFSKTEVVRGETFEMYTSNMPTDWNISDWPSVSLDGTNINRRLTIGSGTIELSLQSSLYFGENPVVKLKLGKQSYSLSNTLHVLEPWTTPEIFPTFQYPLFVASAEKVYAFVHTANGGTLSVFNSETEQWEYESILNTSEYNCEGAIVVGSDIYFFGGRYEASGSMVYRYSIQNKTWIRLPDCPLPIFGYAEYAFALNNQLYLGTDNGMYAYNPTTSAWEKKTTSPRGETFSLFPCNVSFGGKGYFASHSNATYDDTPNELWEYNPDTDSWTKLGTDFGYILMNSRQSVAGNKVYLVGDTNEYPYNARMFEFDPPSGSLKEFLVPPIAIRSDGFPFVSGQYLYVFNLNKFSKMRLSDIPSYYR